jgi:tetratricopeptide (TPR) repeat protein
MDKDSIKLLIEKNELEEALVQLNAALESNMDDDELFFMRGNVYRKQNQWKQSLDDYCSAVEINPSSPAAFAYDAVQQILEFYNKDMYNP